MSYEQILYEAQDSIATLTLNRPEKLNAWTNVLEQEVRHALTEATADAAIRVIILTGAGRGFCAGADMALLNAVRERSETAAATESPMAFPGPIPGGLDLPRHSPIDMRISPPYRSPLLLPSTVRSPAWG